MNERGIKCGRGNHYHPSVVDVRRCFNGEDDVPTTVPTPALDGRDGESGGRFVPPSARQMSYLKDLLNRDRLVVVQGLQNVAKRQASELIGLLTSRQSDGNPRFRPVDQPAYCKHDQCWERAEVKVTDESCCPSYYCAEHGHSIRVRYGSKVSSTPLDETAESRRKDATQKPKPDDGMAEIPGLNGVRVPKAPEFDPQTLDDGFYALPDPEGKSLPVVYKVIVAVHGSGFKYAKRLNSDTGDWDMARGAIQLLRPEHEMTLEQALKVAKVVANDVNGALYGRCFRCGRTLTAEDSIERFMGPVCASKFA